MSDLKVELVVTEDLLDDVERDCLVQMLGEQALVALEEARS